jgi:excisionase family DNA binding protein
MSEENGKILYSRVEAAKKLSLSLRTVGTLISKGSIRVRRVGGRVLISHRELERFAAEGEQAA